MTFNELKRLLKKEFNDGTIEEDDGSLTIDYGFYYIKVSDWGFFYQLAIETDMDLEDLTLLYTKYLPRDIHRAFNVIKSRVEFIRRFLLMESI